MSYPSALRPRQVCAGRRRRCPNSRHGALVWRNCFGSNEPFLEPLARQTHLFSMSPISLRHSERLASLHLLQYSTLSHSVCQHIAPPPHNNSIASWSVGHRAALLLSSRSHITVSKTLSRHWVSRLIELL